MHDKYIERWMHDHTFGQDRKRAGERRTLIVIAITAFAMVVEIVAGLMFGSMALLADGLHMGSHASALAISAFAYYYTRRRAGDARFNFSTGKVNSLAAFASAVMLVIFSLVMGGESVRRFIFPVDIGFNWSIIVAVGGLLVNGVCLVILGGHGESHSEHDHGVDFHRPRDDVHKREAHHEEHAHEHHHHDHHGHVRQDQNLWSAYLHVTADALTSVLAIFALLGAKYMGQYWLDPLMGIAGAVLIVAWSWKLLASSGHVLLDMQAPVELRDAIKLAIEKEADNRVSDLHVWAVGPGIYAAEIAVVSSSPQAPEHYTALLPRGIPLVHVAVQVHTFTTDSAQHEGKQRLARYGASRLEKGRYSDGEAQ
ncbi:MAG: cation transporter [Verrucomicrobia bacterium]|nr:cation transporter [Verrucomicrobiota bacterium]